MLFQKASNDYGNDPEIKVMSLNENASLLSNAKGIVPGLHGNGSPCNTDAHTVTTPGEGTKLKNTNIVPGQEAKRDTTFGRKMTNKYKSAAVVAIWQRQELEQRQRRAQMQPSNDDNDNTSNGTTEPAVAGRTRGGPAVAASVCISIPGVLKVKTARLRPHHN